jgi:hypothetical protein
MGVAASRTSRNAALLGQITPPEVNQFQRPTLPPAYRRPGLANAAMTLPLAHPSARR